ncbi:MAG: hypothetical protein E7265_01885 [Lachnospiraceae bacterium]|nr:hypothetical protein [Lachnospiraceae bacterium]
MKFCKKPWEYLWLYDAEKGSVLPCCWLNGGDSWGNILEESVEEIYNSEFAKRFRESIIDGSYRYCDDKMCRLLSHDELPDMTEEEINDFINNSSICEYNVAYEETCNHACPSCRSDYFKGCQEYYDKVRFITDKMMPYYNKAKYLSLDGRGDLFASKEMMYLLENLEPENEDLHLLFETNGALFDENHWSRIERLSKYNIEVCATVNSFVDSTYRYLNGYANHVDKVIDNLYFMKELREKGAINKFTISMIVQEANFREMPSYVRRCLDEFGADKVRLRAIMQYAMKDEEYWFKDVYNPLHPSYEEAIDILHDPIIQDPRVWTWEADYENGREAKEYPLKRYEDYYKNVIKLVNLDDNNELQKLICDKLQGKNFALYGGSDICTPLISRLRKYGYTPVCVFDSNKSGSVNKVEVYNLFDCENKKDILYNVDIIINTISFYKEDVKRNLKMVGYRGSIVELEDFLG